MEIRFNRPQALAHQRLRPGHSVAVPWGRGVGKSWFERTAGWYLPIAEWDGRERPTVGGDTTRGVRIVHLQPTFKSCKDVHKELVEADLAPGGRWGWLGAKIDRTSWAITFPGGSWIKWFGAREANAARGIRCDIATVDEGDDVDPGVFDAVLEPWFSEPWSLRTILLGGTPRRGRYGLLHREHKAGLEGNAARLLAGAELAALSEDDRQRALSLRSRFSFHATWRDAPETVDGAFVARVRAKLLSEGAGPVYEREWECNFDSAEGLVYSLFDEAIHLRRADPRGPWTEVLVGVDHGWEDPGVFTLIGVQGQGQDAIVHVFEEIYERHQLEGFWVEKAKGIKKRFPTARWYGDPSRPDRIAAIERGADVRFQPVNNAIEDGVSAVANRMATRPDPDDESATPRRLTRFYVDPSCRWTRWELANYRRKRDPRNADRFLDDIEDKNNHAMDAVRYPIMSRFGKPTPPRGMGTASIGLF